MQLHLSNIKQVFAGRTLFEIDSLVLQNHQLIHLQGENGSGKSTLMKMMAGLIKPTVGKVTPVHSHSAPTNRSTMIYLHQIPYLFDFNVRANVAYGLKLQGKVNAAKIDAMLAWARLEHIQDRPAHLLSGGERQRLALARALVLSPSFILMDEPSSHLDKESQADIQTLLLDLPNQGTGCLITCHQETLPAHSYDVIWRIDRGKVQAYSNHAGFSKA